MECGDRFRGLYSEYSGKQLTKKRVRFKAIETFRVFTPNNFRSDPDQK